MTDLTENEALQWHADTAEGTSIFTQSSFSYLIERASDDVTVYGMALKGRHRHAIPSEHMR